jgi:hypothetical protein
MTTSTSPSVDVRRGRRTLLVLAAVFFVPLLVAFVLYYGGLWRPATMTNHGELLDPPVAIENDWARGAWSLVHVADARCESECLAALVVSRQTRLALAQEMSRVQRVLIAPADCCDGLALEADHPGLRRIEARPGGLPAAVNGVYVVDPLGNAVMRFDARENPKGLLTDLKKLLKLSHIG